MESMARILRSKTPGMVMIAVGMVLAAIVAGWFLNRARTCQSPAGFPTGGAWTTGAPIPTIRAETSATELDDRIYVAGGMISDWVATNALEVYDTASDIWRQAAPMPLPIHHAGVAAANGRIYVTGGYDDMGKMVRAEPDNSRAWVYDPQTDTWSSIADLPAPRAGHAMVTVGDKLYLVGGTGSGAAEVWTYDPATDIWNTHSAPMSTLREHVPAIVVDGHIYVIGGRWNDVSTPAVEVYDPTSDTWERKADLPTPRSALSLALLDGRIHAVGGEDLATGCTYGRHEAYDPQTDTWTTLADQPVPRHAMVSAVVDGRWYLIGGSTGAGAQTEPSLTGVTEIFSSSET